MTTITAALDRAGFTEQPDGTLTRQAHQQTITVDPAAGFFRIVPDARGGNGTSTHTLDLERELPWQLMTPADDSPEGTTDV